MFAEELGGNANKRRQEEARARRRKLKEEQDKKQKALERAQQEQQQQQQQQQQHPVAATSNDTSSSPLITELVSLETTATGTNNAAVANALQQRQQRQTAQHQRKAVTTIQSFYRAHRSNVKLLQYHSNLLSQRLQDLNTLTTLLRQQRPDHAYVPPPATATALSLQLLFLTRSLPYSSHRVVKLRNKAQDSIIVRQLFRLALLPGIYSQDENGNPFLVWLETNVGRRRIETLLRVALLTATTSNMDETTVATCSEFVRALSGAGDQSVPPSISVFGQSLLWASSPPVLPPPSKSVLTNPIATIGFSLDWISVLRFHLLFNTGGPEPIPKAAERVREACIPTVDKTQADILFRAVLKGIQQQSNKQNLQFRLVSEILTIPLLNWKTADASTQVLLNPATQDTRKPYLIQILDSFIQNHGEHINSGEILQLLHNDTSLTTCPATATQSLLANLLLIARSSPSLNGIHPGKLDFESATLFYQFLATLVHAVPLATFISRESVVEWVSDGKGHHSPVVLSSVVMEQCRYLLVDSFVRKIFDCAIDSSALQTETILQQKNEKDIKQEMALQEAGANAASLASKEARVDRSKSMWNSAAWARRIKGGVSKLLSTTPNDNDPTNQRLTDSSAISRRLAEGREVPVDAHSSSDDLTTRVKYTPDLLKALCRLYGIILARWGGGGSKHYIRGNAPSQRESAKGTKQEIATTIPDPCTQTLLNTFIFSTNIIKVSWALIQSDPQIVANVYSIIDPSKGRAPVRSFSIQPYYSVKDRKPPANSDGAALLFIFISALSHVLIVTDDSEIHEMGKPLPIHQLRRCIQTFKQLLYRACCVDDISSEEEGTNTGHDTNYFGLALVHASARTMRDLYDRSSRRPLAVPKLWLIEDLMEKEIRRCKTKEDHVRLLSTPVLRICPFLVSFKRRLKLFERIVTTDRVAIQGENSQNPFNTNPLKPGIPIRITRGRILEDGLATMNHLGRNMRERLSVQYFNEAGTRESGIDAGGLFKEFWTDLCAIAFDPNYALFRVTAENCMYPNPSSAAAHGSDHIMLFEFLGRILGKALYEGITVHPQFAHFFLSHLRGDYKYLNMLSDLSTMDSQLYNNIMFLKTYDGDASDLCLSFTVTVDDFGGNKEIPLMANGADVEVTNANKQRYIQLVAKYYVVDRIKEQAEAFTRGLREVIDKAWLEIFNEPELQVLISGASGGKIDVEDMRANCRYAGGFTGIDRTVNRFWNVVASMDSKQQGDLLRFITSCERPPPLGFASLNPPLTIQRVGIMRDGDKLPASSTCFNVLKLPTYSSEKVMKERLLYAIQSGAGFELT